MYKILYHYVQLCHSSTPVDCGVLVVRLLLNTMKDDMPTAYYIFRFFFFHLQLSQLTEGSHTLLSDFNMFLPPSIQIFS